jgi:YbbR domain-containing protein
MIKFLRHLFLDDVLLKLFSLALALLFWITVSFAIQQKEGLPTPALPATTEARKFFNIPVVVVSSAWDVHNFKVSPDQVEVKVQGDVPIIENLQSKDLRALVDLTDLATNRNLTRAVEISAPAGVTLLRVFPQEVQVTPPPKPSAK